MRKYCPQKGKPSFSAVLNNRREDDLNNDDGLEIMTESLESTQGLRGYTTRAMTSERTADAVGWLRILVELHPHGTALSMSVR